MNTSAISAVTTYAGSTVERQAAETQSDITLAVIKQAQQQQEAMADALTQMMEQTKQISASSQRVDFYA